MQTLGISDATVRTESRLKSLFWPSIQNAVDVDYLGTQGYWVCAAVSLLSFLFNILVGNLVAAIMILLIFYVGGIGVRERDRFAATMVFMFYLLDTISVVLLMPVSTSIVIKVLILGLLMSNMRATWIAAMWRPDSEEAALPARMNDTFADKMADQMPMWLWPKIRWVYYVLSSIFLLLANLGVALILIRRLH